MNALTPYRLAVIDLDDTLLDHQKTVSPLNRRALDRLQSAGLEVVIASGRHHDNIAKLSGLFRFCGWIISSQGAQVQHSQSQEIIYSRTIPAPLALELYQLGREKGVSLLGYHQTGVYLETETPWTDLYTSRAGHVPKRGDLRSLALDGLQKLLWSQSAEQIDVLSSEMERAYDDRLYVVETEHEILEFCSPEATKALGTCALSEKLSVAREEIVAFGDGNNDVPLLNWAGMSVAMNHGRSAAKAAAKLITPPGPHESAFARAVDLILS